MKLSGRQFEILCNIRDLEMSGQMRFIYAKEAVDLCTMNFAERQPGLGPSYRLTPKGWRLLNPT
jgi:hypothetical protein